MNYTVRVPSDVSGGRYAVLFFESLLGEIPSTTEGVSVQYTGRLGSLFEIGITGTVERTGLISALTLGQPADDRPLTLEYTFQNTGNVAIRPKAFFNIVDRTGQYFGRGEFDPLYTFPGRSGSTATEWTGHLPPGEYTVLLTVDLGENEVLVAEQPLSVKQELLVDTVVLHDRASPRADVMVHNTGHVQIAFQGTVTVLDPAGGVRGSWRIDTTLVAAGERRQVVATGAGLFSTGAYQCRVRLMYDGGSVERTVPCVYE